MKRLILLISICIFALSSCITYKQDKSEINLTSFPPNAKYVKYSRKPIIQKLDNNFVVSDEFVENSILFKKHIDKVDQWKIDNKIK